MEHIDTEMGQLLLNNWETVENPISWLINWTMIFGIRFIKNFLIGIKISKKEPQFGRETAIKKMIIQLFGLN